MSTQHTEIIQMIQSYEDLSTIDSIMDALKVRKTELKNDKRLMAVKQRALDKEVRKAERKENPAPKKESVPWYRNFQKWSKTAAGPDKEQLEAIGGLRKWQSSEWKKLTKEQKEDPDAEWNKIDEAPEIEVGA